MRVGRAVLLLVLACVVFACSKGKGKAVSPAGIVSAPADSGDRIPVNADDPSRGSPLAYVTLVVFTDFRSTSCNRFAPVLDKVRDAYRPDVLRIVFKHKPAPDLPHSKLASTVAQGVFALKGIDSYFTYRLLASEAPQTSGPDAIRKWAFASGVTAEQLDLGLERGVWAQKVDLDADLARKLGVNEPPASFVNGAGLSGTVTFEALKDLIDLELGKAKMLEMSGVPRAKIYAQAVAANMEGSRGRELSELEDPKAIWRVPVGTSPVRGRSTSLVTFVVFSDFDCPACTKVAEALAQLRSTYGDRIRVVWKDFPAASHPRAIIAAQWARAARAQKGDSGFWEMHDRLFAATKLDDAELERLARAMGMDVKSAQAVIKAMNANKDMEPDRELAEDVEVAVSPQIFVNGRRLIGPQPYPRLVGVVDEEIRKAEALVRSGIEPSALYEWFIKDGRPAEPVKKVVPLNPNAPFKGAQSAPIVVQEFAEHTCVWCRRGESLMDEVLKAYPGQVKLAWRDIRVDPSLAAEAAREAFAQQKNDGFWGMHSRMGTTTKAIPREDIEVWGKELSLDLDKLKKSLDARAHNVDIEADARVAAEAGIRVSPTFVVGPYVISGVPSRARLLRFVARAIAEAPPPPKPAAGGGPLYRASWATAKFLIEDLVVGTGMVAKPGDTVSVHYRAHLLDGPEFDKRAGHVFVIGSPAVIAGLSQGIPGMRVGGRRRITIPPELGYGNHGVRGSIPPNAAVVYEVTLAEVQ